MLLYRVRPATISYYDIINVVMIDTKIAIKVNSIPVVIGISLGLRQSHNRSPSGLL